MANREKGEASLQIGDETYTLCLDLNAMAIIEEYFSTPTKDVQFYEAFAKLEKGGIRYTRAFIWAGLQKHHKGLSIEATGELIQRAGGLYKFGDKLKAAVAEAGLATVPDKADLQELGVNVNASHPQKARPGRGARSTSKPAVSV